MSDVTWIQHPMYTKYEVSNDGRVRRIGHFVPTSRGNGQKWLPMLERKFQVGYKGYLVLTISIEGKLQTKKVHRMVCEAFHGTCPAPGMQVRHLNGDKLDNRPENLKWGTSKENAEDMRQHRSNPRWTKTHCKRGHEFTKETTYDTPKGRECKVCRKLMMRKWQEAKRATAKEGSNP